MTVDPRSALESLVAALERHFEAATASRDPDHPRVVAAATDLAEAFDDYDEALYVATEVATPLAIYGEELEGDDDDDDGGVYAGLESEDYDDDEDEDDEDEDEDDDDEDDVDEEDDDDTAEPPDGPRD
jgi:pyruvate/2-oxoacid:ferredoxin oxidoreductase alpha subunit